MQSVNLIGKNTNFLWMLAALTAILIYRTITRTTGYVHKLLTKKKL